MKKTIIAILVCLVLVLPIVATTSQDMVVLLGLNINKDDTAEIKDLAVRYGFPDRDYGLDLDYKLIIYDQYNNKVVERSFSVPFTVMPDFAQPGVSAKIDLTTAYTMFRLPYNVNYRTLEVRHNQKRILLKDIGQLLCNKDGSCDIYENYLSCAQDCDESSHDGFCEKIKDSFCDADCEGIEDPDCKLSGCGDRVCDSNENHNTCPQDCPSGIADNYCDGVKDSRCDPDCYQQDPDCPDYKPEEVTKPPKPELFETKTILFFVLLAIIAIIIIFMLLMIRKKRGGSYLEKRMHEEKQPSQAPTQKQGPFGKYRYMYEQKDSIRKR